MEKTKVFDTVKVMREIRDRMSAEMKGMTPDQVLHYLKERVAAPPKEPSATAPNTQQLSLNDPKQSPPNA